MALDKVYVCDCDAQYEIADLVAPADIHTNRKIIVAYPGPFWHQWVFTPV